MRFGSRLSLCSICLLPLAAAPGDRTSAPHLANTPIEEVDFPPVVYLLHGSGQTRAEVVVSPAGKPVRCRVVESSGFPQADGTTCERMMKAGTFKVATDQDGTPVYGSTRLVVNWMSGYDTADIKFHVSPKLQKLDSADVTVGVRHLPPGISAPADVNVDLVVDETGAITHCAPEPSPAAILGGLACTQATSAWKVSPATDAAGNPVRSVQQLKVSFHADPGPVQPKG